MSRPRFKPCKDDARLPSPAMSGTRPGPRSMAGNTVSPSKLHGCCPRGEAETRGGILGGQGGQGEMSWEVGGLGVGGQVTCCLAEGILLRQLRSATHRVGLQGLGFRV